MEFLSILESLEKAVDDSIGLPLTGKNLIDKEEVLELLKELRLKLPEEIKRAKWIIDERERIVLEAQKEAEEKLKTAESKLENFIEEHDITKQAYEQANDIVINAQKNAKEIRVGTREYADGILIKVQDILKDTLNVIETNREELRN